MTVTPGALGVTTFSMTEATLGSEDVKIHGADELDVGGLRARLLMLSFLIVMPLNAPRTGAMAMIVIFMEELAIFQLAVPVCVAVMRTDPGDWNMTLLSTIDAMFGSDERKLHVPSEVVMGGVITNVLCVIGKERELKTPRTGVP